MPNSGVSTKTDMIKKALDKAFGEYVKGVFHNASYSPEKAPLDGVVLGIDRAWGVREELMRHYGVKK